jgi:hypothetical protein
MAAAAGVHVAHPKKVSAHADRLPRDGLTGMSFGTQKHFIDVQHKLINFIQEQEDCQCDEKRLHQHAHHRNHHLDPAFLDGKKPIKPQPRSSKSNSSQKQLAHLGLATPQQSRRHIGRLNLPFAK